MLITKIKFVGKVKAVFSRTRKKRFHITNIITKNPKNNLINV